MADDLPQWVQNLIYIGTIAGSTVGAIILGRKKGDTDKGLTESNKGESVVLAGSFVDRNALLDLAVSVRNLDGTAREILEVLREAHTEREIEQAAQKAVRDLLDKRKGET